MVNIFIVEDDNGLRKLYKKVIDVMGHRVIGSAENGEDAIQKFKNLTQKPDLIIMDYKMPIKNGLEATKEILKIDGQSKIFFISGEDDIKEKVLSIGAIGFERKPLSLRKLRQIINLFHERICVSN